MGNVLEFYLKMKDMMSSGLVKVAQTAQSSFKKVQSHVETVTKKNDILSMSFNELKKRIGEVETRIQSSTSLNKLREAKKELRELQQMSNRHQGNVTSGSNSGASRSGLFGGMFSRFAPSAMIAGAVAFGGSSVKAAMDYGATSKSFEVLTGSTSKGKDLTSSLNNLQQSTILGPEVFKAAQTMMSFGVAADKVVKIEKQLGDVSMGNRDKFEALTLAYSQTQAAGRLMGQDLLQYINAGFNPLQVMSERWKEFGLKQKMSVGQLKEAMEKGSISAGMVAKAFELATSKGGKFNNMMDAVAQTEYGKMQILQGQWENFKIQSGNALMPLASGLMDVASKTMSWLNITKTAPEVLISEKAEITSLLGVITSLNQHNDNRHRLLNQLVAKYPDLFGKINIETVKNGELLTMLNNINSAYEKRIGLATSDLIIDTNAKVRNEAESEKNRYLTMVQLLKQGDPASIGTFKKLRNFSETIGEPLSGGQSRIKYYQRLAGIEQGKVDTAQGMMTSANSSKALQVYTNTIAEAFALAHNKSKLTEVFGKDTKGLEEFMSLAKKISYSGNKYSTNGGGFAFAEQLRNSMSPKRISANDAKGVVGDLSGISDKAAKGITSGGPRVINISGVKMQVGEHVVIQAAPGQDPKHIMESIEPHLDEYWLRLLNSGSNVQDK